MNKAPLQKERLILAIEELGGQVTSSDVALNTGLPLSHVTLALQQLANDSNSHILVTASGEVCFQFAKNLGDLITARDTALRLAQLKRTFFDILFFLTRVLFGITLLMSIWMFRPAIPEQLGYFLDINALHLWNFIFMGLYLLVIFGGPLLLEAIKIHTQNIQACSPLQLKLQADQQSKWMELTDSLGLKQLAKIFSWRYHYQNHKAENVWQSLNEPSQDQGYSKASIFHVCFSFVFGDGSPNYNFEELQWQVVAEIIKKNQGAVTVEQLAPYLCCPPDHEDSMLPVLVRFGGYPEVSKNGHIIYIFPELVKSQGSTFAIPKFLTERSWKFSNLSFPYLLPVWLISTLTLLLSYGEFVHPELAIGWWTKYIPAGFTNWHFVLPFSIVFCVIPGLRFAYVWLANNEIEERNKLRAYFAQLLEKPEPELTKKLEERTDHALIDNHTDISKANIIYTTRASIEEQEQY